MKKKKQKNDRGKHKLIDRYAFQFEMCIMCIY